ncbi:MAG: outer membrane beta-barrel protein [Pseudomonadales bacterium]|nr:outer membrane beta-barrel protein [Pseudomonadales bacterium]
MFPKVMGLAVCAALVAADVYADPEQPYVGLNYGLMTDHTYSGNSSGQRMGVVVARFGDDLNEYFGVEAHLATGGSDAKLTNGVVNESLHLYSMESAFAKPQIQIDSFSLYGLLGLSAWRTALTGTMINKTWQSDHSAAVGAGVRVPMTSSGKWLFDATYVHLKNSQSYAMAGVDYRF